MADHLWAREPRHHLTKNLRRVGPGLQDALEGAVGQDALASAQRADAVQIPVELLLKLVRRPKVELVNGTNDDLLGFQHREPDEGLLLRRGGVLLVLRKVGLA